jgi:hypothetical protein
MIFCIVAGAIYLGVVYPIYRIVVPDHGASLTNRSAGQPANSLYRYGFGSDWQCFGKGSGPICYRPGAFKQAKGN